LYSIGTRWQMNKLLKYLNRYFPRTIESVGSVVGDGFVGNFKETYLVGQYVLIKGSILSDGVYKLTGVSPTKLTVSDFLEPESTGLITIFGLAIPRELIALEAKIQAYTSKEGVASESIDDYSVSYKDGSGWQTAFKSELNAWRIMYSDLDPIMSKYRWQDRWC
jgi:hypothetical protein